MQIFQIHPVSLILCGAFYMLLCVFSIVTGLIYMSGKKKLNPLELSDRFMRKLSDEGKLKRFTVRMGAVTFLVGIIQGITAFAFWKTDSPVWYWIAMGFTVFSIASVALKLKGKINAFPLLKLAAYLVIFVILLLPSSRELFF